MNPWIPHLLRAGGGGGGPVLPPAGRTMLANLTSSLILDEGTGVPTWSRATKAWGFNELGYLEELASGCAFFGGARLVRNLFSKSELFSAATWSTIASTKTDNGNGSYTITGTGGTFSLGIGENVATVGATMLATVRFSKGNHRYVGIRVGQYITADKIPFYDFDTDTVSNIIPGATLSRTIVSPGVIDLAILAPGVTTSTVVQIWGTESDGSVQTAKAAGKTFIIWRAQLVDVTNYDSSYVPEYVSVGVLSAPFHGAGIDGAKYFETDWQGAPIPAANLLGFRREAAATNNLLQSRLFQSNVWASSPTGSELCVNGDFGVSTGWTAESGWAIGSGVLTGTATSANTYRSAGIVSGKTYTVSFEIVSRTNGLVAVTVGNQSVAVWRSSAGVYTYNVIGGASGNIEVKSSGFSGAVDNISVKEAAIQTTTATGLDGIANTATTLTATAADATILQPITLASAARCASAYVKRRTGTGAISFTQDGGSTWTDITSQINSSTWSRVQITATLANPSVGFKISTSGDAIDVDCVQNEAGSVATSPIVTTTATVTRNAESLTYQTAGNIDFAVGTAFVGLSCPSSSYDGFPLACTTSGRIIYCFGSTQVRTYDGTTIISQNSSTHLNGGKSKIASSWSNISSLLKLTANGSAISSGAFDGAMGSGATINIGGENSSVSSAYIGPVAIYNYQMTDAELQALTT